MSFVSVVLVRLKRVFDVLIEIVWELNKVLSKLLLRLEIRYSRLILMMLNFFLSWILNIRRVVMLMMRWNILVWSYIYDISCYFCCWFIIRNVIRLFIFWRVVDEGFSKGFWFYGWNDIFLNEFNIYLFGGMMFVG